MKCLAVLLLCAAAAFAQADRHSPEYRSADHKFAAIVSFESNPTPGGRTTVLTDREINAYFNEGGIQWPDGVSDVRLDFQPAVINGSAQVDFDKVTAKNREKSPMMALFTGVHTVRVQAQASAVHGRATIRVQSVSLDGLDIPRAALEFFVQHYLQPKYPEFDLDTTIGLPYRIETAIVGDHQITLIQR